MARIHKDDIERLKQEVSVQRLAESRGIALKRRGTDLIGCCPFHDDQEYSLIINPKDNHWQCLGDCQTGGTVIDWVMKAEGVSFRHAVELLRNDSPTLADSSNTPVKRSTVPKLPTMLDHDTDDQRLLMQVVNYYHETLKQSPEALDYLDKRGLNHPELIEHFRLGYANRTLGYRLPEKNRKAGAAIRGQLQRLGILRDSGHEHFNGSLIIPVINTKKVLQVYGRKVTPRLRPGTPLHLYLPGSHQGAFNLEAFQSTNEIILCGSLIDALTFWAAGYRNMTATYGTNGFTDDHLVAFRDHGIQRVLIAYKGDKAGRQASEALAGILNAEGIDAYRVKFPGDMDANEYANQGQHPSQSLGAAIRSAEWLGKGTASVPVTSTKSAPRLDSVEQGEGGEHDHVDKVLPATPLPNPPPKEAQAEVSGEDVTICFGDRHYRIRGLKRNLSYERLKVNLLITRGDAIHVDTFDLYAARPRAAYIKQAAVELGVTEDVIKKDLGRVLLSLEGLQDEHIQQTLEAKETDTVRLSESESQEALALLKDPNLLNRVLDDFSRCGVVGEETNKLVGYLAAVSRKLAHPLAVIIQSTSAAGKTSLMDAILAFMPEEDRVQYSAMTGQSLFYLGESDLKHKILAIAEEEGAHQAAYALKLLQSEGQLTIASTGKDPESGKHTTFEYKVAGPVMLFLTTTAIDIDEELMNRCLVLSVDENRDQTKAIHQIQRARRTLNGLLGKAEKDTILVRHRNAQRLLRSLAVVNPYAEQLTFLNDRTRTRRDHEKYLTLIDTIALLHQYQRAVKTVQHESDIIEYIEVSLTDIEQANKIAHEVLGRSLDDLPPQTRRLLMLIDGMVDERTAQLEVERSAYRFTRRELRSYTGWGDTQLKIHLRRLVELEYLLIHRESPGNRYAYELLYDGRGKDGQPVLSGLVDIERLKYHYDADRSGSGRCPVEAQSVAGHTHSDALSTHTGDAFSDNAAQPPNRS